MMHNITSDCKIFTRLANRGQNGGKTGGGSAENKVIIGFFLEHVLKKKTPSLDSLHSKNINTS